MAFAVCDAGGSVDIDPRIEEPSMDLGESAQVIVTLYETGVVWPDQCPAELFRDPQKGFAPIRKDGELDMVRAERHGTEGKEIDIFGSHSRKKIVRVTWVVLDSGIKIVDGTHAEIHDASFTA